MLPVSYTGKSVRRRVERVNLTPGRALKEAVKGEDKNRTETVHAK